LVLFRARSKLVYNALPFQYLVALMIVCGFVQDMVEAQTGLWLRLAGLVCAMKCIILAYASLMGG